MFINMIYLCCYFSSRRPSDVGSTATNYSCTLLIIDHAEPKSVYTVTYIRSNIGHWCIVLILYMLVSYADNINKIQNTRYKKLYLTLVTYNK